MRLINIDAFLRREQLFHLRRRVEYRTKVLEFRDDETTNYAILSHRWIDSTEVDYEEMVDLARMDREEQDEIRGRQGYKKTVDTCKQAKRDGYEWLWIDTCCIDKRSSAELSEAINSMYRWYANAKICYAYLHDVGGSSLPTGYDHGNYYESGGHPEWFSRGWTLQEMVAPRNLQFFNKDWQPIGDKKGLAVTLNMITGVPRHILENGLEGNRPPVAQIISWAARRMTTRVEDRAYSLMGLLNVNMPMLYGEGKKAFHRLQLEIIRSSNDQSVFAWGQYCSAQIGGILADDPSDFKDCSDLELMDHDEFIENFPELSSTNVDHFDVFPITNRGIQIWMLLRRYRDSNCVFRAYLPCWDKRCVYSVSIDLVLWNFNYYRYPSMRDAALQDPPAEFRQVYLRYQDTPNHTVTFDIDDSGIIANGFTPEVKRDTLTANGFTCSSKDNTFMLTNTDPFYIKTYSEERGNGRFNVDFGQCLGLDWVHLDVARKPMPRIGDIWKVQVPDGALSMADAPSQLYSLGRLWVYHHRLPGSTWIVRIYRVAWERLKIRLRMEIFQGSHFQNDLDKWNAYDVENVGDPGQDQKGFMLHDTPCNWEWKLLVDGVPVKFSLASEGIKLGDYGYVTDSGQFRSQGNLFSDFKSLFSEADITPRQKTVTGFGVDIVHNTGLSLPNNPAFNSFLASLAPRLMHAYLVTRVVHQRRQPGVLQTLCTIRKPVVWHLELIACASLKDDLGDSRSTRAMDDSESSSDDPEM